jgi:hypothetical protein
MAETADRQDALFVNLVMIFQNAAMQQMGKITNPLTGKIERNLDQARFSIDMIDMLRNKTRGNVSSDLEKLLDSTLTNLRMNYVEESGRPAAEEPQAEQGQAGESPEAAGSAGAGGGVREDGGKEPHAKGKPGASGESPTAADAGEGSGGEDEAEDAPGH